MYLHILQNYNWKLLSLLTTAPRWLLCVHRVQALQSNEWILVILIVLTALRVMVTCRDVLPFNGPFSSNLWASSFDVINCEPSHTVICLSSNWWPMLATLHSALSLSLTWPQKSPHSSSVLRFTGRKRSYTTVSALVSHRHWIFQVDGSWERVSWEENII